MTHEKGSDTRSKAMGDSPHWQTALLMLDWGDQLGKLESWITGRTVAPHWTEFVKNWLQGNQNNTRIPPLTQILKGCMNAWTQNTNEYYLKVPDTSSWNERDGLGHYIRLLTMIVRENMASNGIWKVVSGQELEKCFRKALVISNCLREEWVRKGSLYEHFRAKDPNCRSTPI